METTIIIIIIIKTQIAVTLSALLVNNVCMHFEILRSNSTKRTVHYYLILIYDDIPYNDHTQRTHRIFYRIAIHTLCYRLFVFMAFENIRI